MEMKFVLATRNSAKLRELREILSELKVECVSPDEAGYTEDVEEDGETFFENAMKKAKAACAATGLPAIADDSGLCVDALNGGPGVYSARYGGPGLSDADRRALLLDSMRGGGSRSAHFLCCICCVFPNGEYITAEGRCDGNIAYGGMGYGGFGYDPIFIYPPAYKTFAQMTEEEKNAVSHRGKALREFAAKLKTYLEREQ